MGPQRRRRRLDAGRRGPGDRLDPGRLRRGTGRSARAAHAAGPRRRRVPLACRHVRRRRSRGERSGVRGGRRRT
ncbi:hypothetical protein EJ357_21895 [Streptomyces cyaneochromogenes]|uniref:Uncharacterized protein n=1 Tax=Streptomyces cyaneochromogenes TaxID=2496836 RepID=A0A3Q9ETR3_9ACTN|nr:hypothetical protein EJ357_21895 [Streptomyces cyaneochromogenes]